MFLKKRPRDLPKPSKADEENFSLFRTTERKPTASTSSAPSRFGRTAALADDEVIDVEVVERRDDPPVVPAAEQAAAPVAAAQEPAPQVAAEPSSSTAEGAAVPAPARAPDAAPGATAKPGLRIRKVSPAAEAPAAQPTPPTPEPTASVSAETASASAGSWASALLRSKAAKPAAAEKTASAPAEPAPKPSKPLFGRFGATWKTAEAAGTASETKGAAQGADEPKASSEKESSNVLGRFARKSAPAPTAIAAPAAKKRWSFGRDSIEKKKQASARSAKPARSVAAARGTLDVLVELEGGRRVCWRVSPDSVQELDLPEAVRVVSFSRQEHRFHVEAPLSYSAAYDLALSELGEEARIVNASKSRGTVYATSAERLTELRPLEVAPGLLLVDELLSKDRAETEELICALVLKGEASGQSLALLYHFSSQNEVSAMQVTVNPDNLNFVLSQFASARRLDVDTAKVVLFGNADLLSVASKLQAYPSEAVWNGVSVRKILWGAALASAVGAGVGAMYATTAYVALAQAERAAAKTQQAQKEARKEISELVGQSVQSFARMQSLPLSDITARAGELWTPGARVSVDASAKSQVYAVTLPLTRGGMLGNRPSVLHQLQLSNVEPLLKKSPPEGCTKAVPEVSGGMNVVQITVTCESPADSLSAYRLD